ncbi:EG45-like domain containing protein [Cajanus cajan]|nr:EG45-like domain containing protein [Cajanus cajan]
MPKAKVHVSLLRLILSRLVFSTLFIIHHSLADVGTAAKYGPPFLPTACFGRDASQFPSSNMFAAAGEAIWDNGAACGRQYQLRCISAVAPGTCTPAQTIQIKIVDRAQSTVSRPSLGGTTMVLSTTAFQAIANVSASFVNVEYQQV